MNLRVVITKARGPKAPAALQGMTGGWNQQIDKLSELVAKKEYRKADRNSVSRI